MFIAQQETRIRALERQLARSVPVEFTFHDDLVEEYDEEDRWRRWITHVRDKPRDNAINPGPLTVIDLVGENRGAMERDDAIRLAEIQSARFKAPTHLILVNEHTTPPVAKIEAFLTEEEEVEYRGQMAQLTIIDDAATCIECGEQHGMGECMYVYENPDDL